MGFQIQIVRVKVTEKKVRFTLETGEDRTTKSKEFYL